MTHTASLSNVSIRQLEQRDLPAADRIFRHAFGTFLGLSQPESFAGDADLVSTRWRANPGNTLAADLDGELVGSNFVTNWGSFGFFGPLSVRTDLWSLGIASRLLEETLAVFERLGTRHMGLFTYPQSSKHLHLYQKFGFWPRFLTPLLIKRIVAAPTTPSATLFSQLATAEQTSMLAACREMTSCIYDGLDLSGEIRAVEQQRLGETLLLLHGSRVAGLVVCHFGAGSEAGSDMCYIKFGAARTAADFQRVLAECESLAAARGAATVLAGVNTGRHHAYQTMLSAGFGPGPRVGIAMHRPNEPGYNRPDVYAIDDWR